MNIAVCSIIKNEPYLYLKEFIQHHLSIGFDKVFIYNNNNSPIEQKDDFLRLQELFKNKLEIIYFPGKEKQFKAYRDCTAKNKDIYEWIAYIDADEFIEVERASIKDILKNISAPALGLNWQMFGTGIYDGSSQIKSFVKAIPINDKVNQHVKVIARPKEIDYIDNPHNFIFKDGKKAVNILGKEIETFFTSTPVNKTAWINHYYCRTEEDKKIKLARGRADVKIPYKKNIFDDIDKNLYLENHSNIVEKQRNQHIALVTPTGNRKFQIELCAKYMERQNFAGYVDWYIVDDCEPFTTEFIKSECNRTNWNINIIHPTPYWQEGDNTQGRNIIIALDAIANQGVNYDGIFMIEDDDWYSPDYLSSTLMHLDNSDITGGTMALYWNVPENTTERCSNTQHSSLCQTAFTPYIIQDMLEVCKRGHRFFDMDLFSILRWKGCRINLFRSNPEICIGIKGLSGRGGIGNFHEVDKTLLNILKPRNENIYSIIGDDYKSYLPYIKNL